MYFSKIGAHKTYNLAKQRLVVVVTQYFTIIDKLDGYAITILIRLQDITERTVKKNINQTNKITSHKDDYYVLIVYSIYS